MILALPKWCGYPWALHGKVLLGSGCGMAFKSWNDVYRCSDCTIPMHRRCLVAHFGDGKDHDVGEDGIVRSQHRMPHHFALQLAWMAEQVTERDDIIDRLRRAFDPEPEA